VENLLLRLLFAVFCGFVFSTIAPSVRPWSRSMYTPARSENFTIGLGKEDSSPHINRPELGHDYSGAPWPRAPHSVRAEFIILLLLNLLSIVVHVYYYARGITLARARNRSIEIIKPCAEWKLRAKLWKAWRERGNRFGVKIEGPLEICGISALAPPTCQRTSAFRRLLAQSNHKFMHV
jgi:hypothetical protein